MNKKILFVDDEPNVLAAFQRQLHKQFSVETALGPEAGLEALKNWQNFAVIVADMRMPGMDGVEFLALAKERAPDIVRMMLTGNADQQTAMEAINQGNIFRFLTKPCPSDQLIEALEAGLRQHELITAERDLLENTLCSSIKVLTEILAITEPKTFAQAEHLRNNIRQVAAKLKIKEVWPLEAAAMLAPIGRITIPPEVALKARLGHALSIREKEMFQRIPEVGANLLSHIPRLERVTQIICYQNKRFDGTGIPEDAVRGEDIPFGARLLKIMCDLLDLESTGINRIDALEQLQKRQGWYDPKLLESIGADSEAVVDQSGISKPPVPITFSKLRIGHVLRSDVQTKAGLLIVVAGNHVTPPLLERLKNFASTAGIKEPIYIEHSDHLF